MTLQLYPQGRYNLNFDISAMLLAGLLFLFYITRPRVFQERRTKYFMILLGTLFLSALLDFSVCAAMNSGISRGTVKMEAAIALTHLFSVSQPYFIVLYLLEALGFSRRYTKAEYFAIAIPEIALITLLVMTTLRHLVSGGSLGDPDTYALFFKVWFAAIIVFYMTVALLLLHRTKNVLLRREYIAILALIFAFLVSMIPQFVNSHLKMTRFLVALCMLGIYITLENNADLYDTETGLRTRTTLWRESEAIFSLSLHASVVSIKLGNTGYLAMMLGIPAMKELYHQVGMYLQRYADDKVHAFRLSSHSYALLFLQDDPARAEKIAADILDRFQEQWPLAGTYVYVAAEVWISHIPEQIPDEQHLSVFVDSSYDTGIPDNILHRFDMLASEQRKSEVELALQRALSAGSLMVYYQPIYDTREHRIRSCEALVRMHDEKLGDVSPEEFIRVAEQTGLVGRIGELVFEKVCTFWETRCPQQYGLSFIEVNLSTIQCMDKDLPERFQQIMKKHGVKPEEINLEITESAVIHDEKAMQTFLASMRKIGFSFALDDFGTGNANFSYVMKYPFRLLKIDKSFLWGAEKEASAGAILDSMLELTQGLGRDAVVEGVETKAQRDYLVGRKVRYLQGYYYAKPIPEQDFLHFLENFNQKAQEEKRDGAQEQAR